MSAIPWEDYASPDGDRGVMQVLRYSSVDNSIAWVSVVAADGGPDSFVEV